MHLLRIDQSVDLHLEGEAVDLDQQPAGIAILSAADTEIGLLALAVERSERSKDAVRLANILSLSHPYSVDLYIEKTLGKAEVIVVRLLGGVSYWAYGIEQISAIARSHNIHLALLPGDGKPDPELMRLSTLPPETLEVLNAYLVAGGMGNACAFLDALDDIRNATSKALPPQPLLEAGIYWPQAQQPDTTMLKRLWDERGVDGKPVAALVFYRALAQSGDTAPIDTLVDALIDEGLAPLPIFVASLKDRVSADITAGLLQQTATEVIINTTAFAIASMADSKTSDKSPGPFGVVDAPVLQAVLASSTEDTWRQSTAGLNARDLAMSVVLPELDGRIITRAVGFKTPPQRHALTGAMIARYSAHLERAGFVAKSAAAWVRLKNTPRNTRRLGLIMANYPNKDSRLGNGVGLDTPASAVVILKELEAAGYDVRSAPAASSALIAALQSAPTNSGIEGRQVEAWLTLADYVSFFDALPESLKNAVVERWGEAHADPMLGETIGEKAFALPVRLYGQVAVATQPARGYNIDPKATYHAPDLPPPHHYFAFYFWLRHRFDCDAVIHLGKHGNLEWLPGKALALSDACFPDGVLGGIPHFYPFIVNDPGEGSQAKRRVAAVIIDHLTPPLTLADSHGVMAELETLMDEYFESIGLDARRGGVLLENILMTADRAGITADCGIERSDSDAEKLLKLDNFLCDLKEMQIRDGLHIFGRAPEGGLKTDLLTAILRIPRGDGEGAQASILRTLAKDLGLGDFDPLTAERALPWEGARPQALCLSQDAWRHQGDTVERLNLLATALVAKPQDCKKSWQATRAVIDQALPPLEDALIDSGVDEIKFLLKGLDGGYVPAAPAGAPTRGRPEVLPTGRNFYSIDSRAVPTAAAWQIGWASASALIDRFLQDNGNYPRALALSAWGTANMRTGGDDVAQMLALMGVKPQWDTASRRVTGFEILPLSVLARPRVDVTLRASGFFRDAFPFQIDLLDKAARAVGALDEPEAENPIAAKMRSEEDDLLKTGMDAETAALHAGFRVFSAKPGAYGAGLQALIDEGIWEERADFADAFIGWSSYAYSAGKHGVDAPTALKTRLKAACGVVHNQDNREHDILDSDDYYQFAGGLAASIATLKGEDVPVYMADTSLGERPQLRTLGEEITRVVRGRASNPKWIRGVMRHGYKGAFEMAASLDYLFAFAATTRQVPGHLFDALFEAWIEDKEVHDFLEQANPQALGDMLARFHEAVERGLWQPRRNSITERLASPR